MGRESYFMCIKYLWKDTQEVALQVRLGAWETDARQQEILYDFLFESEPCKCTIFSKERKKNLHLKGSLSYQYPKIRSRVSILVSFHLIIYKQ